MRIITGDRGDWYTVDYTIGDDPVMRSARYKFKDVNNGMLEGRILPLLAQRHGCDIGQIRLYGHINRGVM